MMISYAALWLTIVKSSEIQILSSWIGRTSHDEFTRLARDRLAQITFLQNT